MHGADIRTENGGSKLNLIIGTLIPYGTHFRTIHILEWLSVHLDAYIEIFSSATPTLFSI